MKISYPYFLHLIRYLFFILCIFATICMFFNGFSPFKYILSTKARVKTVCGKDNDKDPFCMEGKYKKLVLVIVEGWNSMNSEQLEYSSIMDPFPFINNLLNNKLNSIKGTSLFMKMNLGNKTSSSVFLKAIMTGNFPGLIDIPKQMYFNNSYSSENSGAHTTMMDQDNILLRIQDFGSGKSVLIGGSIADEGLKNLFSHTDVTKNKEEANSLVKQSYKNYINDDSISFMLLNMNIGNNMTTEGIKMEFGQINDILSSIASDLDENTILCVTGNKAFDLSKLKNLNKFKIPEPGQEIQNFDDNPVQIVIKTLAEDKIPYTGLFLYTSRASKYKYDYTSVPELHRICPNPKRFNKIKIDRTEKEVDPQKSGVKSVDFNMNTDLMMIMNNLGNTTNVLNLTATISSLMGYSIPFSNVGGIIPNSYVFESQSYCSQFYKTFVMKFYNNLRQLLDYREDYFHSHRLKEHLNQINEADRENNIITDDEEKNELIRIKQDIDFITSNFMEVLYIEENLIYWIQLDAALKEEINKARNLKVIPSNSINPEVNAPESKISKVLVNETQSNSITDVSNSNQNNIKTFSPTNSTQKTENDRIPSELWKKLRESVKSDKNSTDSPKLMKLGGFKNIQGLRKVKEPTQSQKILLKNYLLKCENTINKIYKYLNYISASINQDQEEVDTAYFEIATAFLFLVIIILGFRVVAFIFDNAQNYKQLPMEAKQERIEEEPRQAHNTNLYIARNLQLVIFALISLHSFEIVKMFPFFYCIVFSVIIFCMVFTAISKVFKEGLKLGDSVNLKRIIISFISAIVGIGYALDYSKSQDILCFGLIILQSNFMFKLKLV